MTPALKENIKKSWEALQLPSRATSGSAGYDFKAPFSFSLDAGDTIKIPTGIRVKVDEGWWLGVSASQRPWLQVPPAAG